MDRSDGRKADLIGAVRTLWLFRDHMPAECRLDCGFPWAGQTANEVVGAVVKKRRENKTPRIADATMEALLAWVLVMIEQIGPEIRDAWLEYQQLEAGTHPSQAKYTGGRRQRLLAYIEHCQQNDLALPGQAQEHGMEIAGGHINRLIGIPKALRNGLTAGQARLLAHSGLAVSPVAGAGTITGRVNGKLWRENSIDIAELPTLVRLLSAALFTAICYLSGMRPGEVLNLRRGCCSIDDETGELQVNGHRGKGFDRTPDSPDITEPLRPWVVVDVVHAAIALLESLHDLPLLFPSSLVSAHLERPATVNARKGDAMNSDIQDLISWINASFRRADGSDVIPADPAGRIYATRYRRTLARFIVRRPRGLIAAALQYGHVDTKVTLSYAGNEDPAWLQDVAVEKLELIIDQIEEDVQRLEAGEHVSGPSAQEYRTRMKRAAPFPGRVVTSVRNAERLLEEADPAIHHGQGMTCVWRAATAACRKAKLALGLPGTDAPDESECRSSCANLAYTDRDIAELQQELPILQAGYGPAGAQAAPGPGRRPGRTAPDRHRTPPRSWHRGRGKGHRMTRRHPRDRDAERAALRNAADRLLAGTPLRSESGRLTATELLRESGLRRDVAYGDHKDLVEEFQARVRAQNATPSAMQELADKYSELKEKLAAVTDDLTKERSVTAALRRIVAELDLELRQAREELEQSGNVTRLPAPRRRASRR